jgi:hypothetical protein
MADILHQARQADQQDRPHQGRLILLAVALVFTCVGLAFPAYLMIAAVVPVLIGVVAVLAAFRVMG